MGEDPKLVWFKSHVDLEGNELADQAAKRGAMDDLKRAVVTPGRVGQWDS